MGAMLAGADGGDATKYRPEYSRHQIRKSSSISMKADQMLSLKLGCTKYIFSLLLKTNILSTYHFYSALFVCLFTRPF